MGKAKQKQETGPELARVHNAREGAITLGNYSDLEFPPGVCMFPVAALVALPQGVKDVIADLVSDGVLKFGPEPESEPEAPPAPAGPAPLPPGFQPLPDDDTLALAAIEAETDAAKLAAWFDRATGRPAISDAILARTTKLDSK